MKGVDAMLLTPEDSDVSIAERCRRANAWCRKLGKENVAVVSLHVNAAAGNGWSDARGWLCMVDDAAGERTKSLAEALHDKATEAGLAVRHYKPRQKWYLYGEALGKQGARLGLLRGTQCAAVLTENLFMTNKEDAAYLNSDEGKKAIAQLHAEAIAAWISAQGK